MLAISRRCRLGIDLELIDPDGLSRDLPLLAETVLTPAERGALTGLNGRRQIERFLQFWTAKEAHMKLTGEGLRMDPKRIALHLEGGLPLGYLRPSAPPARLRFVTLASGLPAAVCCLAWDEAGIRGDQP